MQRWAADAELVSPCTGEIMTLNPRRFRVTVITNAADEGASPEHLAVLADHTDLQNVQVYLDRSPNFLLRIRDKVDAIYSLLVSRFKGRLVERGEAVPVLNEIPGVAPHLPLLDVGGIGVCGSKAICIVSSASHLLHLREFYCVPRRPSRASGRRGRTIDAANGRSHRASDRGPAMRGARSRLADQRRARRRSVTTMVLKPRSAELDVYVRRARTRLKVWLPGVSFDDATWETRALAKSAADRTQRAYFTERGSGTTPLPAVYADGVKAWIVMAGGTASRLNQRAFAARWLWGAIAERRGADAPVQFVWNDLRHADLHRGRPIRIAIASTILKRVAQECSPAPNSRGWR